MIERRFARAAWFLFASALAASCGGSSISRTGDGDAGAEAGVGGTGGDAGNGSAATGGDGSSTGGATTTGGSSTGTGGAAGSVRGGGSGASGGGGEGAEEVCSDLSPSESSPCGGNLVGTWTAQACSLQVSGVVDFSGLGLSPECAPAPVTGSLRVTGAVTFDENISYSDHTITSGESTFELAPECLVISGTPTTCEVLGSPLQALGYASLRCVDNAVTEGCTCAGTIQQTGGLGFVSLDASTNGTYRTAGDDATLTSFGHDTNYSYCVSREAQLLTMSLQSVANTGTVVDPIVLVKP